MTRNPSKADGRRTFTVDFKREAVGRIVSGEKTLAELSRELGISQSVLRNWMRLVDRSGTTAVAVGGDVVPAAGFASSNSRSRSCSGSSASRP
jgi:transposase-like protein